MAKYKNPFTPVLGNEPPILAGRTRLINDVMKGLENGPGDPNRISDTDIQFLLAMVRDAGESRMADISSRMEVSPSYASHYKRRLVNQGVVSEAGRGKVAFNMPMLKEMLAKKYGIGLKYPG